MKAKTNRPDYVYVTYIHTTPEKLWAALTDASLIPQFWLGRVLGSSWKKGGTVESRDPDGDVEWSGKVLESRPPRRLVYSFQMAGRNKPVTYVTYELELQRKGTILYGKGVKLTVTHAGFVPGSPPHQGISWGWPIIMSGLKSLLETGRVLATR